MSPPIDDDDWRLQGQEGYLLKATLYWRVWHETYLDWDHDHCEFCWAKFTDREMGPDTLREGYATDDEYRWICATCAADFRFRFAFKLIGGPASD